MKPKYDFKNPELNTPHPEKFRDLRRKLEENLFEEVEEQHYHNPYDQELREQAAIEHGDMEALEKSIVELSADQLGKLSDDDLRNMKDMGIVVITLASRSAIRGGMRPEVAFSMSDLYIQRIEKQPDVLSSYRVTRNAEFEYCRMVREIRENRKEEKKTENEHVTNAKNYIYRHLHGRLTAAEVADALGLNANYLSGLFRRCVGITMTEYILQGKISLVKNLLKYSAYNFGEIASYLGFSSQSHLAAEFRKRTGMTMSEYRQKYQMQEFI